MGGVYFLFPSVLFCALFFFIPCLRMVGFPPSHVYMCVCVCVSLGYNRSEGEREGWSEGRKGGTEVLVFRFRFSFLNTPGI